MADRPTSGPNEDVDYESFVSDTADFNMVETLDGRCRYASTACERLFGWTPADLEGERVDDFVHPDDLVPVRVARDELPEVEFVSLQYRFVARDGSYRWVEASCHFVEVGGRGLVVSTLRDITERQRQEADLQVRARTDPLTGVANRTVLMDRIEQGLRRLDRGEAGLAVLYLDLDRFKVVNDSLGHHIGDQILMGVAERISEHLRPADTLARLGGDEFVIVADDMPDRSAAVEVAERIVEAVRPGIEVEGNVFECTLSVGIAWTVDPHLGGSELLREADLALYRAKDRGRDRIEVFDEELQITAASRLTTERMLRGAIDEDRVVIEYQPIVDLRDGHAVGAEALVRIRDADTRLVLPDSFLEVAEETGMLVEIDQLVLADALARVRTWHSQAETAPRVAINVTARHLADTRFPGVVLELLDSAGVAPSQLQVELTERTLIEASHSAVTVLRSLRETGVQVGLDDFGTGYASLAYLRQFPLDYVKLDRSFIHDLEIGGTERSVVWAIIRLAHALSLTVVGEGVESDSQRAILLDLGCDRAQGFHFAQPVSADAVRSLLAGSDQA